MNHWVTKYFYTKKKTRAKSWPKTSTRWNKLLLNSSSNNPFRKHQPAIIVIVGPKTLSIKSNPLSNKSHRKNNTSTLWEELMISIKDYSHLKWTVFNCKIAVVSSLSSGILKPVKTKPKALLTSRESFMMKDQETMVTITAGFIDIF